MKKQKLLSVAVVLLFCLLCTFAALAESFGTVSNTYNLNLRSAASSSSQWLGSYTRDTWVQITGSQGNFYKVYVPADGRTGYMSMNYITPASARTAWTVIVTNSRSSDFLNFRSQPSYNAPVLGIFYNGVPLLVRGQNNGWYTVEINGQTGYVRREFVTDQGSMRAASSTVATIKTPNNTVLNLRSGPGYSYPVTAQVSGDRYVMVLQKGSGWWYVSIDGRTGFMSDTFLKEGLHAARDEAATSSSSSVPYYPSSGTYYPDSIPSTIGGGDIATATVATSALNLREYPTTAAAIVARLYNGTEVYVLSQGADWCQVTDYTTGYTGYVMTQYLHFSSPTYNAYMTVRHPNGSYVNLRSSADMYLNNVLVQVPSESLVTLLSSGSVWSKVRYNGVTGYMMTCFLTDY